MFSRSIRHVLSFGLVPAFAIGLSLGLSTGCEDKPAPAKAPPAPAGTPAPGTPAEPPSKAAQGLNVVTQGTEVAAETNKAAGADTTAAPPATPPPEGKMGEEEGSEIAYAYSPIGKRDPFRSLFEQLKREEGNQQLTELQLFEIDQLKLVAIVSRIATPYAMVEDPNAKGHTLTRGTLIGKNWGRITEISPDCITIKEEYRDYTGRKVVNKVPVCLPKSDDLKLD